MNTKHILIFGVRVKIVATPCGTGYEPVTNSTYLRERIQNYLELEGFIPSAKDMETEDPPENSSEDWQTPKAIILEYKDGTRETYPPDHIEIEDDLVWIKSRNLAISKKDIKDIYLR
jgi:hypothetical protein